MRWCQMRWVDNIATQCRRIETQFFAGLAMHYGKKESDRVFPKSNWH